jgi:hypothetical protein
MLAEQNKKQKYYIVRTKLKTKNTTLSEENEQQKILHCRNKMKNKILHYRNKVKNKKYYAVGTK